MESNNKLVLWDIDGTLMHCGSCGRDALNITLEKMYGIDNAFSHAKIGATSDVEIINSIFEYYKICKKDISKLKEIYEITLKDVLSTYESNIILPGILDILDYIKLNKSIDNGLMTSNFRVGAYTKLKSLNLEKYFKNGGFGDIGNNKIDILENAINDLEKACKKEFKKSNIYVVGDTPFDIRAAKYHNVKSIAVATGFSKYDNLLKEKPDYIFKDLSDFKDMISILTD